MSAKATLTIACLLGLTAVLFGAFGAHGLSEARAGKLSFLEKKYADVEPKVIVGHKVPAAYKYLQDYKTAVRYHMWHALLLLALGCLATAQPSRLLKVTSAVVAAGTIVFCGALYTLVIAGPKFGGITWGLVAPIGGSLLMVGWILAAISVSKLSVQATAQ